MLMHFPYKINWEALEKPIGMAAMAFVLCAGQRMMDGERIFIPIEELNRIPEAKAEEGSPEFYKLNEKQED